MTWPTGRFVARSSAMPSIVSCTGISSSTVTRWTWVVWLRIIAMIELAWRRTGPTRASPATSSLTLRNRAMRPVGGASMTTASYANPLPFCRLAASYTLPVSRTSRTPGAIVVAKSMMPKRSSALPARPSR